MLHLQPHSWASYYNYIFRFSIKPYSKRTIIKILAMLKCKPEAGQSQRNVPVIQYDPLYNYNVWQNMNDMQTNFMFTILEHLF